MLEISVSQPSSMFFGYSCQKLSIDVKFQSSYDLILPVILSYSNPWQVQ